MWLFRVSIAAVLLSGVLAAQVEKVREGKERQPKRNSRGIRSAGKRFLGARVIARPVIEPGRQGLRLDRTSPRSGLSSLLINCVSRFWILIPRFPLHINATGSSLRDGKAISGRLLNQDPYSLQMIDSDNQLVAFERSELREWGFTQLLRCPLISGTLNTDELADLLAYLASLKGVSHP